MIKVLGVTCEGIGIDGAESGMDVMDASNGNFRFPPITKRVVLCLALFEGRERLEIFSVTSSVMEQVAILLGGVPPTIVVFILFLLSLL